MKPAWWPLVVVLAPLCAYLAVEQPAIAIAVAAVGTLVALLPFLAPLRVRIERPVAAPIAPELLLLPLIVEARVFSGTVVAVGMLVGFIAHLAFRHKEAVAPPSPLVVLGAILALILPFSRPLGAEVPYFSLAFPLLALGVLVMSAQRRNFHTFVTSLIDGLGLYLVVNVVAYFAGVVSPVAADRTGALEGLGGATRIIFPIAGSLAAPAALAAIYVAAAAITLERASRARMIFRVVAFGAGVFVLIGASTRAAMVVAVLLLLAGVLSTRLLARSATPIALVSVAFAFVYGSIQFVVERLLGALLLLFPSFSRGGLQTDTTLNFRSIIWERTLGFWVDLADPIGQLFGFGIKGQQQSGASLLYAANLSTISTDPKGTSVHNSFLQQLFDGGLVGLVAFSGVLIWASARCARMLRAGVPGTQIALPALLAALMTGMTEVTLAPGYGGASVYLAVGLAIALSAIPGIPRSGSGDTESSSFGKPRIGLAPDTTLAQ